MASDDEDNLIPEMPKVRAGEHKRQLRQIVEQRSIRLDSHGDTAGDGDATGTLMLVIGVDASGEEQARRTLEEMDAAVAQKHYRLLREQEGHSGDHEYIYELTLPSDPECRINTTIRLEGVSNWDELQDRQLERLQQRHKQFLQAVAEGRARIVSDDVYLFHVCREAGREIEVMKVLAKGRELAVEHALPRGSLNASVTTEWREHLDALALGKRQFVEARASATFMYEFTLPDGSTVRYRAEWVDPKRGNGKKQ